jgi:predicted dehydrogenase
MKDVTYAVIGAGWISQEAFMPAVKAAGNSQMLAIVSGSEETAKTLAEFYDIAHVVGYDAYDAILEMDELDAVYIALPNALHAEYAIRAAKAGKHVLVEKPLAVTSAECQSIIDAARENNVYLMTAYRLHMEPGTLDLLERIQSGEIGEPRLFSAVFSAMIDDKNHRLSAKNWGGPLQDVGIYCLNAARHVFGCEPVAVNAMASQTADDQRFAEIPASVAVTLEFPGGKLAQFLVSFDGSDTDSYTVVGSKGALTLDPGFRFETASVLHSRSGQTRSKTAYPEVDHFAGQTAYFSDCIQNGTPPMIAPEEGLADVHTMRVIEAAIASGKTERIGHLAATTQPGPEMRRLCPTTNRRLVL